MPKSNVPPLPSQLPHKIAEHIWHKDGQFWMLNGAANPEYKPLTERHLFKVIKMQLAALGKQIPNEQISTGIAWLSLYQSVEHVIPRLAGYPLGLHEINGASVLVPIALSLVEPEPGDTGLIDEIISNMLGPIQTPYFWSWLKVAYESLKHSNKRPGQVVIFVGPQKCGKNLTQEQIITPILGGRWAEPYRFAIGRTEFNAEQFSAAHHMISDQKNPRDRADIQEFIRRVASNEGESLHPKNRDAIGLPIFRRMTISCNDTEKDLQIVPPLDGLEDKLFLFLCQSPPAPFPGDTDTQREAFASDIAKQIPALAWALENYDIPADLRDSRFRVKGYQHPELVEKVAELEPEKRLLSLFLAYKQVALHPNLTDVTAGKLYAQLDDHHSLRNELYRICGSPSVLGKRLQKLIDRQNGLVGSRVLNGENLYTIKL